MFKNILLSAAMSFLLLPAFTNAPTPAQTVYVYICNGPKSVVYHKSPDCRGLSHCSTKIEKVTLSYAEKIGRRACKIESK
jgi:hypothetical protein